MVANVLEEAATSIFSIKEDILLISQCNLAQLAIINS
jgi:hypothetical protein